MQTPFLQSLFLHLTYRCNLSCPHCYVSSPSSHKELSASLTFRLIDELHEAGGETITLSGGEPLLHPQIKAILEYAASRINVEILTNGSLIDSEWASFLTHMGNISVQVSMDGSTGQVHDSIRGNGQYEQVIRAVDCLQEAGLGQKLTLCATVMKKNLRDLEGIIRLAESLGVRRIRFLPLRKVGRARKRWNSIGNSLTIEDYERFFDHVLCLRRDRKVGISCGLSGFTLQAPEKSRPDDLWCPVGHKLVVDVNGEVYPCVLMMNAKFLLGNVFEDSLADIIHSPKMLETCRALSERRTKIEDCVSCNWRNFCQGDCMGQALEEKGTIWAPDSFCRYRKKAYAEAFDRILDDFRTRTAAK